MASNQRAWRYALTIGVAGITASCAWFGAGLKGYQEHTQERKAALQASPEQKIQNLETVKAKLMDQSLQLQRKIESLENGSSLPSEDRGRQRG